MMRANDVLESTAGLLPFGHVGWGYRTHREFLTRAVDYIIDGLAHNQRVVVVGDGSRDALITELTGFPELSDHLDTDRLEVLRTADHHAFRPGTDALDPAASLEKYLATLADALAADHSGLRVIVDVTSVARSPEQRAAVAALEILVDREMAVRPFSALCGYDIGQLGAAAAELVCLHPFTNTASSGFRLFADPCGDIDFVLAGEVDAANHSVFTVTLSRLWPTVSGGTARVDAQSLTFIGHRQLIALDRQARAHDCTVVLYTDHRIPSRLVDLVHLTNIRVERSQDATTHVDHRAVLKEVKESLVRCLDVSEDRALAVLVRYSRDTGTELGDVVVRVRDALTDTAPAQVRAAMLDALKGIRDELVS